MLSLYLVYLTLNDSRQLSWVCGASSAIVAGNFTMLVN